MYLSLPEPPVRYYFHYHLPKDRYRYLHSAYHRHRRQKLVIAIIADQNISSGISYHSIAEALPVPLIAPAPVKVNFSKEAAKVKVMLDFTLS